MSRARGQYMWSRLTLGGHFGTLNLFFNRELCFASALFQTFSLSPTTVALKLALQSPRKETMRIKSNNHPMSERAQLHFDHLRIYELSFLFDV